MSIDARIRDVRLEKPGLLRLDLEPRYDRVQQHFQLPGQQTLWIADPTWVPVAGMEIWGNAGDVVIAALPPRRYTREGYVTLRECKETNRFSGA